MVSSTATLAPAGRVVPLGRRGAHCDRRPDHRGVMHMEGAEVIGPEPGSEPADDSAMGPGSPGGADREGQGSGSALQYARHHGRPVVHEPGRVQGCGKNLPALVGTHFKTYALSASPCNLTDRQLQPARESHGMVGFNKLLCARFWRRRLPCKMSPLTQRDINCPQVAACGAPVRGSPAWR